MIAKRAENRLPFPWHWFKKLLQKIVDYEAANETTRGALEMEAPT
jgi:hypothetical protein